MNVLELDPKKNLSALISSAGVTSKVYTGGVPTTNLPDSFISIMQNGSLKSSLSRVGMVEGLLAVSINTKLKTDGTDNDVLESLVTVKLKTFFGNENESKKSGIYHYELNLSNIIYSGRSIASGYKTTIINLQVKIY